MILLTDTLDYEPPQLSFDVLKDPVAAEGQLAADLKRAERFTVVIGNPPYDREQRVVGDHARRKGGVVRHGAPGIRPLLEDLITPLRENGLGHHAKNLYNDYIYFWRWAIWQAAQKPPGPGIVAFITASSFLDGVSSGGLRSLMRREFDEIWFVDLGGDGRGARQSDDNIFDILTPVAITIAIKTGIARNSLCKVNYLRIDGSREDKLKMLAGGDLMDLQFESVEGQGIDRFTPISGADYHTWLQVSSLFPWIQSGSQPKRNWVIGPSKSILSTRWRELLKAVPRRRSALLVETRDRTTDKSVRALFGDHVLSPINKLTPDDKPEAVLPYGWRSFDRQWIIADNRVLDYARPGFWKANGTSQIFLATLTTTQLGSGPAATVTCDVPDMAFFRGSYGAQDMMPLYRDALGKNPNVTRGLLAALSDRLSSEISAEDLLAYVFGLTGTSAFTDRFRSELDQASGPFRVPITTDVALFRRAVDLGSDLLWWQTRGSRFAPHGNHEGLPIGRARELTQVQGCPDDYSYEAEDERLVVGTGTFGPIPVSVWEFEVSGLKVLQSWLAYRMASRKGRKSSELDDIGLQRWTFSTELLELISILEHTIEVTPSAATLLKEIIDSALIDGQDLPMPTAAERKAPKG
jgi:predicted helicase